MAWGYYMNMEKLSLTIVNDHIENMTNNNYISGDCFLDNDTVINNLKNGFVIITQLSCFFESYLNTIINACMNYEGEVLLKCSVEEKLDLIFMHYKKSWHEIKAYNPWSIYRKATKVRNEMIHFKKTYIGHGGGIPDFKLGGESVATYFVKESMKSVTKGYIDLAKLIADSLGLKLFGDIDIFECDGRDGLVNYVYCDDELDIDR